MFSIREVLDIAIRLEENGETVYRNAMNDATDPVIATLLEWMADEEGSHARCFERMRDSLEDSDNPIADEMASGVLHMLLGGQSFSLNDVDFSQLDSLDELIEVFIEFERDTVLFYEMLKPFVQDEAAVRQLDKIIHEENNHIRNLRKILETQATELMSA